MSSFNEYAMRSKIDHCLKTVAVVLDSNKVASIAAADHVSHRYEDKYLLANHLTNTAVACALNGLEQLGAPNSIIMQLKDWNSRRAVSLKFERKQKCKFIKEITRDVEDPTRVQADGMMGMVLGTVKVITKVKEYVFLIEEEYSLSAFSGVGDNPSEVIKMAGRSSQIEATLRTNSAPFSESSVDTFDVNISWLLSHLDAAGATATFTIDRSNAKCATPRQNPDVSTAVQFFSLFSSFTSRVHSQMHTLFDVQSRLGAATAAKFDLSAVGPEGIFNPIVPLFENHEEASSTVGAATTADSSEASADSTADASAMVVSAPASAPEELSVALPAPVVNQLIEEQRRSLIAKVAQVEALFPTAPSAGSQVFAAPEAKLMAVLVHLAQFAQFYKEGVDFIEHMIRAQLVAAVGKELTARDFAQYMTFHNRKVFKEEFQPKPFSYAVRRSAVHSPEGQLQIETAEATPAEPIYTVAQHTENAPHMEFALNATTTVQFGGERHLHGWMAHRFSGQALPALTLVAQARQFSSYIVLIGRIASAKLFQPKYGFIVQNKDEFRIPLELEQIPTAKEFKDAISSLSPEQQRFAKAFRSMQLESTLFGVCVIQIKPQLEKVLKLQADSLTKEIKLTQDLMQLFIKYQIPSDLLSFDDSAQVQSGGPSVAAAERLVAVKKHVQAMQEILDSAKDAEIESKRIDRMVSSTTRSNNLFGGFGSVASVPSTGAFFSYGGEVRVPAGVGGFGGFSMAQPQSSSFGSGGFSMAQPKSSSFGPGGFGAAQPQSSSVGSGGFGAAPVPLSATFGAAPSGDTAVSGFGGSRSAGCAPQDPIREPLRPSYKTLDIEDTHHNKSEEQTDQGERGEQVDYTQYPNKLEEMYTRYDPDSSLRPTIINPGASWSKRAQAGLLSTPQTSSLDSDKQAAEKSAAFDLLDALTRSGALPIEHASLHVIIAATHCFDQSLMDTVVQKNVNPIERVERSTLILAAALNDLPASALITAGQLERVATFSPSLFEQNSNSMLE